MQQPSAQATDELDKLLSSFLDPLNPLLTGQQGLGLQAFGDEVKAEKGADQGFGQMFSSAPQNLPLHFPPQHSVFQAAPLPVTREQPPSLAAKNSDTFAWEAQLASLQQGLDYANTSGGQAAKGYTQSPESSGNSYGDDYSVRGGVAKGKGGGLGDANFREKHNQRNKEAQRRFRQRQRDKMDELQARLDGLQAKKAEAQRRTKLLHSALALRDEEMKRLRERQSASADGDEDDLSKAFQGAVTLTFREDATVTLTPEQIKNMPEKDLARYWSQYVKELAVLLVSTEGVDEPPPAVVERIRALVQNELLYLYIKAALSNMQNVKRFVAKAIIEDMRVSLGEHGWARWRSVAEALNLTREQGLAVIELWHAFHQRLAQILEQRAQIHACLSAAVPRGTSGREFAQLYLQVQELTDALKKSLRQEHVLIHEFIVTFYLQKLTPMQMAKCFVKSFPYYPDVVAIALHTTAEAGDEFSKSKLAEMEQHSEPTQVAGSL